MTKRSLFNSSILVAALALSAGCSFSAPQRTSLMQRQGVEVPAQELRLRNYAFVEYAIGKIEGGADAIMEEATSQEVKKNAVMWKVYGIPGLQSAAFISDPLVGYLRLWAWTQQMDDFFANGAGTNSFGPQQHIALATTHAMRDEIEKLLPIVIPADRRELAKATVAEWVRRNPCQSLRFTQPSGQGTLAAIMNTEFAGGLAGVGQMNEQVQDISDRLNLYALTLPRQVRWEAELVASTAPGLIASATDSTIVAMQPLVADTKAFVGEERAALSAWASQERAIVVSAIERQTAMLLGQLSEERAAVFDEVTEQRIAAMHDVDSLSVSLLEKVGEASEAGAIRVLDHLLWRVALLMGLAYAGLVLLLVAGFMVLRGTLEGRAMTRAG